MAAVSALQCAMPTAAEIIAAATSNLTAVASEVQDGDQRVKFRGPGELREAIAIAQELEDAGQGDLVSVHPNPTTL